VFEVEKNKYFLVNLNADPSLNELLVYYLKDRNLVGREDAAVPQDIQLSGTVQISVAESHHFDAAPNPAPGGLNDVALAPFA
jgi:hypothetical protein